MKLTLLTLLACSIVPLHAELVLADDHLNNWKVDGPEECWTIENGVLTGKNNEKRQASNLWTKEEFGDFTFEAEFKSGEGVIDSGVFIRHEGDQIQIGISGSLKRDLTASPYIAKKGSYPVEAEGVKELLKEGEWNQLRIVANGNRYTVHLNGKQVLNYQSDTAVEKGPVGLQVHAGNEMTIHFRNLAIKGTDPKEE